MLRDGKATRPATERDAPDPADDDDARAEARRVFRCRSCEQTVADARDRFALPGHAAVQVHTNPAGVIFEILTVRDARNLAFVGEASRQFTWFAGYAWTIVVCGRCARHLGWHFESSTREPARFTGLLVDRIVEA